MVDFLVGVAQATCILGLLYGAYLCIAYGSDREPDPDPAPKQEPLDPVTTPTWTASPERLRRI